MTDLTGSKLGTWLVPEAGSPSASWVLVDSAPLCAVPGEGFDTERIGTITNRGVSVSCVVRGTAPAKLSKGRGCSSPSLGRNN